MPQPETVIAAGLLDAPRRGSYAGVMTEASKFEIFLIAAPGLEAALCAEARSRGFGRAKAVKGGVAFQGNWADVWRANLEIRGATRVLARLGSFRVLHLAQLDKRARKFPWKDVLRTDVPVSVEASCARSRIWHADAAAQRIATAITEEGKIPVAEGAAVTVKARIEDDLCTISIDTSGELLHRRGHKEEVGKAPMRETMAALFLRQCGFDGREPVLDPMCGSGTFVIEAAEMAAGLPPGRARHFAFEHLKTFDQAAWERMQRKRERPAPDVKFYGSDRDAGAIRMSKANAERAGVAHLTVFEQRPVSEIAPPDGPPGLVIVNPPYGARIGEKKRLYALYAALGRTLRERFVGWRVGIVTSEPSLAEATGLPFSGPGHPVLHGGLRVYLFQTAALPQPETGDATPC